MSSRNVALEFLKKELGEHKQQLTHEQQDLDTRLESLKAKRKVVSQKIDDAQKQIATLKGTLCQFDKQIGAEEKKFEAQHAPLMSRIAGLEAVLKEMSSQLVEVKAKDAVVMDLDEEGPGEGEGAESGDTCRVDDVSGSVATSETVPVDSTRSSSVTPVFTEDVDPASPEDVTPASPEVGTSTPPVEDSEVSPGASLSPLQAGSCDPAPAMKCTPEIELSTPGPTSADFAAEIISKITSPKLPYFQKRKRVEGVDAAPVERLKRRTPSFSIPAPKVRKKPGPKPGTKYKPRIKPKPKEPEEHPKGRQPLQVVSVDPNGYAKQFGLRRKSYLEESDVSWRDSEGEEEEEGSFINDDSAEESGSEKDGSDRDPRSELLDEVIELVDVSGTYSEEVKGGKAGGQRG
ncbi:hypothetical protein CJU89_3321 [Yarrowia sp. B02]|nr:hypothetical protein CJU89_3321 [Yarrowia sp. B02]